MEMGWGEGIEMEVSDGNGDGKGDCSPHVYGCFFLLLAFWCFFTDVLRRNALKGGLRLEGWPGLHPPPQPLRRRLFSFAGPQYIYDV